VKRSSRRAAAIRGVSECTIRRAIAAGVLSATEFTGNDVEILLAHAWAGIEQL
jgi:hypothetical protein